MGSVLCRPRPVVLTEAALGRAAAAACGEPGLRLGAAGGVAGGSLGPIS